MTFAKKALFGMLGNIRNGSLEVVCPEQTYVFGDADAELRASILVHNERFFARILTGGDDAAGDSYVDGDWSSPDPMSVVRMRRSS